MDSMLKLVLILAVIVAAEVFLIWIYRWPRRKREKEIRRQQENDPLRYH